MSILFFYRFIISTIFTILRPFIYFVLKIPTSISANFKIGKLLIIPFYKSSDSCLKKVFQLINSFKTYFKSNPFQPGPLHEESLSFPYHPIESSFKHLIEALIRVDEEKQKPQNMQLAQVVHNEKISLPAVHGTPGIGKSAFFGEFAKRVHNFHTSSKSEASQCNAIPAWLQNSVVICVTYNSSSPCRLYVFIAS